MGLNAQKAIRLLFITFCFFIILITAISFVITSKSDATVPIYYELDSLKHEPETILWPFLI